MYLHSRLQESTIILLLIPVLRYLSTAIMKSSTLFPVLLMGSVVQGYLNLPNVNTTQLLERKMEHKRQALGTLTWMIGKSITSRSPDI